MEGGENDKVEMAAMCTTAAAASIFFIFGLKRRTDNRRVNAGLACADGVPYKDEYCLPRSRDVYFCAAMFPAVSSATYWSETFVLELLGLLVMPAAGKSEQQKQWWHNSPTPKKLFKSHS